MAGPITRAPLMRTLFEADGIGQQFRADELEHERLTRRVVEEVDEAETGCENVDLPQLHRAGRRQQTQDQGQHGG